MPCFFREGRTSLTPAALLAAGLVLAAAAPALAHDVPQSRRVGWTDWPADPLLWLNLAIGSWLYFLGINRLWRRAGRGRVVRRWQAAAFAAGVVVLVAALASPIDLLSEQLAWVHMVQHMLLMNVAAPLIVVGSPLYVGSWGLSPHTQRDLALMLRRLDAWHMPWYLAWQPVVLWSAYAAALWIWHWPPLYQAALRQPLVHDLQHVSFFVAAALYWRVLLDPLSRYRLGALPAVLYLFATSLHATLLGVFMTMAATAWYGEYEGRTALWGLSPIEDQQLAGLVMWMPACLVYVVVASLLLLFWLERQEGRPEVHASRPVSA